MLWWQHINCNTTLLEHAKRIMFTVTPPPPPHINITHPSSPIFKQKSLKFLNRVWNLLVSTLSVLSSLWQNINCNTTLLEHVKRIMMFKLPPPPPTMKCLCITHTRSKSYLPPPPPPDNEMLVYYTHKKQVISPPPPPPHMTMKCLCITHTRSKSYLLSWVTFFTPVFFCTDNFPFYDRHERVNLYAWTIFFCDTDRVVL